MTRCISPEGNELLEKALALSTEDRGAVAAYLIESLDEGAPDLDFEEAWQHEVACRMEEIQSGKAEPMHLLEVKLRARKMLLQRKADNRS
jgi:putative addiction module component (TIGR02574 family)